MLQGATLAGVFLDYVTSFQQIEGDKNVKIAYSLCFKNFHGIVILKMIWYRKCSLIRLTTTVGASEICTFLNRSYVPFLFLHQSFTNCHFR